MAGWGPSWPQWQAGARPAVPTFGAQPGWPPVTAQHAGLGVLDPAQSYMQAVMMASGYGNNGDLQGKGGMALGHGKGSGRSSPPSREARSRSPSSLTRHVSDEGGGAAGNDGGRIKEDDDNKKLSPKIKQLGQAWKVGPAAAPKQFRISLWVACDSERFEFLRLTQLSEEMIDLLIRNLAQLPCTMPMVDFGITIRGEIRHKVRRSHKQLLRQNPGRLSGMSLDYNNLATIAVQLGYPVQLLSDTLRNLVEAMCLRSTLPLVVYPGSEAIKDGGSHGAEAVTATQSRGARSSSNRSDKLLASQLALANSPAAKATPKAGPVAERSSSSSTSST